MSRNPIAYLWAGPNTLLGVVAGGIMLCLGARAQWVSGVLEFHGGLIGRLLARLPSRYCIGALTLGHVILGMNDAHLDCLRSHEHVHVRQYEQWGVFFLPAYGVSSLWQILRGRCGYRDNFFERQAYGVDPRRSH